MLDRLGRPRGVTLSARNDGIGGEPVFHRGGRNRTCAEQQDFGRWIPKWLATRARGPGQLRSTRRPILSKRLTPLVGARCPRNSWLPSELEGRASMTLFSLASEAGEACSYTRA